MKTLIHCLALTLAATTFAAQPVRWWKGNLHTHSLWSDGDDYPEMISDWYKTQGYHFLAISDHNLLQETNKWIPVTPAKHGLAAFDKYVARWGRDWVETRTVQDQLQTRLRKFSEYAPRLAEPGKYLLIPSEEISARWLTAPIHLNAANLQYPLKPLEGSNVVDVLQQNIDAVLAQERATGRLMLPHVNHPNFRWAITAEELMRVRGGQFFEVYNGHPTVFNDGDTNHAPCDRVWDIINTWRLTKLGLPLMFGVGTDDAHNYHDIAVGKSNSGRGWVRVRAKNLTVAELFTAMKRGDFYASSGVELADIATAGGEYRLAINAEPGVTYTTQFLGTRKGFDATNQPLRNAAGEKLRVTHRYSPDVGAVLAEVTGTAPSYRFTGEELFVRARVTSSKPHPNGAMKEDLESAWTQPVVPGK